MKITNRLLLGFAMVTLFAIQNSRADDDMMGGAAPMAPAAGAPAPAMGGMMMDAMEMGMPPTPGAAMGNSPGSMAPAAAAPAPAMGGMGMMDKEMGGMPPKVGPGMMGQMGSKSGMATMPATLPAMSGNPHIYHVGATGFFLDHAKMIGLTTEQKTAINSIKKQALQRRTAFQQKIVQGEQQLWALTDSDVPDASQIQAKLSEIEKLRAEKRYDFINSVGEAAKVLTDHQKQMVEKTATSMKSK